LIDTRLARVTLAGLPCLSPLVHAPERLDSQANHVDGRANLDDIRQRHVEKIRR